MVLIRKRRYDARNPAEQKPLGLMREHLGPGFYMVWFQEPGVAEAALERNVRRTLATPRVWDAAWAADRDENPPTLAFLTEAELQVYVDVYTRTGFRGGRPRRRDDEAGQRSQGRSH